MRDANNIEELFKTELHDLESPVSEELWTNIATRSGIATSFWSTSKILGFGAAVLVLSAATWVLLDNDVQQESEQPKEIIIGKNEALVSESVEEPTQIVSEEYQEINNPTTPTQTKQSTHKVIHAVENKTDASHAFHVVLSQNQLTAVVQTKTEQAVSKLNQEVDHVSKDKPHTNQATLIEIKTVPPTIDKKVVDTKTFEPAERLYLEVLIATEKREEMNRESYHFPASFPKIFNPNLSGEAASFSIETRDVSFFKIEIRNQKGQVVFASFDANFVWKGTTLDGNQAPEGTYLFIIESNDLEGKALKPQSGAVYLMRK